MKRHDENLRDVFERFMPPAAPGALEDAAARVLRQLREGRHHEAIREQPAVSRLRYRAAAAVLIGIVGIGLYAAQRSGFLPAIFRVERESSPQAVLPTQVAAAQGTDAGSPRLQLPRLKFAVASVRPHAAPGPRAPNDFSQIKCLGADGLLWSPKDIKDLIPPRRGRCTGSGVSLRGLVLTAYATSPIARVAFPPAGAVLQTLGDRNNPTFVTIEAVADDPERVTKGELQLMLQALLEDRFKARVHTETRELDGHVVTIAKSGIKFKETSGEARIVGGSGQPWLEGIYTMEGVTQFLSNMLSSLPPTASMPVLDKTGLTGTYAINFALEEIQTAAPAQAGVRRGGGGTGLPRQFTTPVPKAVENELGLHLERAKVPVEFIVIDNLEPLTEN